MSYITQKKFALSFILFLSFTTNAQHLYEIKNESDFRSFFFNEITKFNDTISNNVKQTGITFIKFNVGNDGTLDSVKISIKQPKVLIYVLKQVLDKAKIITLSELDRGKTYVLPLFYDYQPEPKPITTMDDLESQVVSYDLTDLTSYLNFDFNGFFNVEESQKSLWGIKCVLLPMIKISRPMVFHYDIKKEEKADLKKPKYQLNQ